MRATSCTTAILGSRENTQRARSHLDTIYNWSDVRALISRSAGVEYLCARNQMTQKGDVALLKNKWHVSQQLRTNEVHT